MMADDVALVWLQDQSRTKVSNVIGQPTNPANAAAIFANVLPALLRRPLHEPA